MIIGILDGTPGILFLIAATLQLAGYSVSSHQTGDSLLDTLFSSHSASGTVPYDLVIVDLLLPGPLSGMEVILRIRARLSARQLPSVLLTAGGTSMIENVASMLPQDVGCEYHRNRNVRKAMGPLLKPLQAMDKLNKSSKKVVGAQQLLPVIFLCAALAGHMVLFTHVLVPMILIPLLHTHRPPLLDGLLRNTPTIHLAC